MDQKYIYNSAQPMIRKSDVQIPFDETRNSAGRWHMAEKGGWYPNGDLNRAKIERF